MDKLITYKRVEVIEEVEKEIQLPAYFVMITNSVSVMPSSVEFGNYFSPIVKICSTEKTISITQRDGLYDFHSYHFQDNGTVIGNYQQVDESEWLKAVEYLKRGIDGV